MNILEFKRSIFRCGFNYSSFADFAGIPRRTLQRVLRGQDPKLSTVITICGALRRAGEPNPEKIFLGGD